jgi:predicted nucleic acid-binding Zn ribbon protein
MKLYTYVCSICGKEVERESTAPVPKCHGKMIKKYDVPNIIFKGSGFYINDKENK